MRWGHHLWNRWCGGRWLSNQAPANNLIQRQRPCSDVAISFLPSHLSVWQVATCFFPLPCLEVKLFARLLGQQGFCRRGWNLQATTQDNTRHAYPHIRMIHSIQFCASTALRGEREEGRCWAKCGRCCIGCNPEGHRFDESGISEPLRTA